MGAAYVHSRVRSKLYANICRVCNCLRRIKLIFWRFLTMGETRMHQYTPEIKQQSKKWTERLDPVPEKAKSVPSLGKVKA